MKRRTRLLGAGAGAGGLVKGLNAAYCASMPLNNLHDRKAPTAAFHPPRIPCPALHSAQGYRALFLSDLHLGSKGSRADMLLRFLQHNRADSIYLVGDTFDVGRFHPLYWTAVHDRLLECILEMREGGTSVIRLPGNHDAGLSSQRSSRASSWAVDLGIGPSSLIHEAADARRYLVAHGDFCDSAFHRSATIAHLGSCLDWLLRSFPSGVVKHATDFLHRADMLMTRCRIMRRRLLSHAREAGLDGIVCGHLHVPALDAEEGVTYANCGDWVRNCTAVAEEADGTFVLVDFANGRVRQLGKVLSIRPSRTPIHRLWEHAA